MQENEDKNIDISEEKLNEEKSLSESQKNVASDQANQEDQSKPKIIKITAGNSVFGYFLGAMVIFGVCFVCCVFLFDIIFSSVTVIGTSMQPTINAAGNGTVNTDTVYYLKTSHYKNLDIVIINAGKTENNKPIIKRIVALPGQKITFKKVGESVSEFIVEYYVDDVLMSDNYTLESQMKIYKSYKDSELYQFHNTLVHALENPITNGDQVAHQFSITLGEDEYFVMGDNRNNSTDSRMFGPVKYNEIAGVVLIHQKYGQTLIRAIWQAIFGKYLPFYSTMSKI